MSERRYDIDWLRVLGILAVFILHTTHFFDKGSDWHLVNRDQSAAILVLRGLIDVWIMPFFFLISGAGAWFALKSRMSRKFIVDRAQRLLVPFFTVGVFLLIPPQLWFERVTHENYTGKMWDFIPTINTSNPFAIGPYLFLNVWSGHLWFLLFLFEVSVLTLPILIYLRSEKGTRFISKIYDLSARPGGILLFLIPLIPVQLMFRSFFQGEHTWADLIYYCVFFMIGYVYAADDRLRNVFVRNMRLSLLMGIMGFLLVAVAVLGLGYDYDHEPFSLAFFLFQFIITPTTWGFTAFLLGFGSKQLNGANRFLTYGNEAVLPFYILHQTVILIVGWYIIRLSMGILPKLLIITVMSFVLIMAIYELLIRRFNVVRFFFGMRPKQPAQADRPEAA